MPAAMRDSAVIGATHAVGHQAPADWRPTRAIRVDADRPLNSWGLGFSVALHVLAVVLLALKSSASSGVPLPQTQNVMAIYLDANFDAGQAKTSDMQQSEQKQEEKKAEESPLHHDANADVVKSVQPKKKDTIRQKKPTESTTPSEKTSVATPEQKLGNDGEAAGTNILGRVRENWLRPKSSLSLFHCRLRIDYLAGGIISNVVVLQGCGNNVVDDSVVRAIWKSQPLPLGDVANKPGNMVLEFTP